jgi:hypothetical protein
VGCTAVHLLSRSFFGLNGFSGLSGFGEICSLEGIALKFFPVTDELTGASSEEVTSILNLDSALHIEIALRTQTAAIIILLILK